MSDVVVVGAQLALVALIAFLLPCAYRVWRGPSPADRLQAIDTMTTLLIGIIVVLVPVQGSALVIDVGIALAALSFVATLAIARYLAEGKVF
jgi:multisubunit Na+/H+ antiporter MnhF subunit